MKYIIPKDDENKLRAFLEARTDAEATRMKRYLAMPDLSRTPSSPLYDMVERVKAVPTLANFDEIEIPEILGTDILFDLFDFAPDHVARSKSDTYYVDEKNVLRTHDTVFWYYYLNLPEIKEKIKKQESIGTLCFGKVYRKDEIDNRHMNTFHQMGAWFLQPDSLGLLPIESLKTALSEIVETVFGKDVQYKFLEDTFPYTDPSLQIEVFIPSNVEGEEGRWIEIMGGGMPKKSVLKKLGLEGYNGWAFGFGLERLAIISMQLPDIRLLWSEDERVQKQLKLGNVYKEVSKYPSVVRDISFIVPKTFVPNDYFDIIRETVGEDMIEEVKLLDEYENDAKFGFDKKSYAYRIIYRSLSRTLTSEEVDLLHKKLEEKTKDTLLATIR